MPGARPHARGRLRQPRGADGADDGAAGAGAGRRAPDLVIVPGDVNSTLAAALTAVKMGIPVAHVESGLRSFDLTMPEEVNRIVADRFSELLFLHSEEAVTNLRAEGIAEERMHFVGNTMIDTLVALEGRFRAAGAAARLGVEPGSYAARHPAPPRPGRRAAARRDGAPGWPPSPREMPVVFPVHPRTRKMMEGVEPDAPAACTLIDPLGYLDFLSLMADAARRPHRLRRHPGGDDLPRRPLLHAARQHRAPGHGQRSAPTPCSASTRRRSPASRPSSPSGRQTPPGAAAALGRPGRGADRRRGAQLTATRFSPP